MPHFPLKPFSPPPSPFSIIVDCDLKENQLRVHFALTGDINSLNLPKPSKSPQRIDGLYHHTCLEIFLKRGTQYLECNFSFSGDWCLFLFDGYRKKSLLEAELDSKIFNIDHISRSDKEASLKVSLLLNNLNFLKGQENQIGLSAILEHPKEILSYWALSHVAEKPDFHRSESFIVKL